MDDAVLDDYLDIVNAVSSVFSVATNVATLDNMRTVLSPDGDGRRIHAKGDVMAARLHFASGAVVWDASAPREDGETLPFLDLMHQV